MNRAKKRNVIIVFWSHLSTKCDLSNVYLLNKHQKHALFFPWLLSWQPEFISHNQRAFYDLRNDFSTLFYAIQMRITAFLPLYISWYKHDYLPVWHGPDIFRTLHLVLNFLSWKKYVMSNNSLITSQKRMGLIKLKKWV